MTSLLDAEVCRLVNIAVTNPRIPAIFTNPELWDTCHCNPNTLGLQKNC